MYWHVQYATRPHLSPEILVLAHALFMYRFVRACACVCVIVPEETMVAGEEPDMVSTEVHGVLIVGWLMLVVC